MPKGKGYGKKRSVFLPKHVQLSSKGSQKRYIKYKTGSPETKAKMIKKASKKSRKR